MSEEELRRALEECGDTIYVNDGWEDTIKVNFSKEVRDIRGPDGRMKSLRDKASLKIKSTLCLKIESEECISRSEE